MSIQFHCPECQQLLQVPDGSEGRQARCSHCEATLTVPATAAPTTASPATAPAASPGSPFAVSPSTRAAHDAANPYSAPRETAPLPSDAGLPPLVHSTFRVSEVLTTSWRITRRRIWAIIGGFLVIGLVMIAVSCGVGLLVGGGGMALGMALEGFQGPPSGVGLVVQQFSSLLANLLITPLMQCWILAMGLQIVRGQPLALEAIFGSSKLYGRMFVANLLFLLIAQLPFQVASFLSSSGNQTLVIIALGIIFLWFIPSIVLTLMLVFTLVFVADRRAGGVEALGLSRKFTARNRLRLALMYLAYIGLFLLVLAPFVAVTAGLGIGAGTVNDSTVSAVLVVLAIISGALTVCAMIAFSAYSFVGYIVAYLRVTGQPTMADPAAPLAPVPDELRSMGYAAG